MVGLILSTTCALAAALQRSGQPAELHAARAAELLAAPRAEDAAWRGMLHQSLARLDHHTAELSPADARSVARAGWEILAQSGADADCANLVLHLRRQGQALPEPAASEGADAALERALAEWGEGRLERAALALRAALARWPGDARLADNLLWLERRPPPALQRAADARAGAQAVLAARSALP